MNILEPVSQVLMKIGVSERLKYASFRTWKHPEELKQYLSTYAENPKEILVIRGKNGVGKSYASVATLAKYYEINKEYPIFYNVSNLHQEWVEKRNELSMLNYKLNRTKLLVLDDLGLRTPTDAFFEFIYSIINRRYGDMKGTIVTTNLNNKEIREKFGKAIISRLMNGNVIEMEGKDQRTMQI